MQLLGISHVLPSRKISNADVLEELRLRGPEHLAPDELDQLLKMTEVGFKVAGTDVRYQLAEGERPYALCVSAGQQALEEAGLKPEDIDLIIYAGIGRGFIEPATATVFQDLLGLRNATCFDVIDACASWLRAFDVASKFLAAGGRYKNIMIITGEFLGRYAYRFNVRDLSEFEHWFPGMTVGEAATAAIVSHGGDDGYAADFKTWGNKRALCMIPLANYEDYLGQEPPHGRRLTPLEFSSFGGQILRFGASKLVSHYEDASDFNARDYDIIFGHPASDGICSAIGRRCHLDFDKFQFTHRLFGNTASASVPLAMSVARREGRLRDGANVLVMFASAGISTALVRFRMPGAG
ncbi:MAG: hypothetical protein IOC63_03780 [Methylobacterium sp.]|nr:hypothetical protein [Methylobacterium sp.]